MLDQTLPRVDRREAAAAELERWARDIEAMSDEEAAANAEVLRAIDDERSAGRKLFTQLLSSGER